MTIDDYKKILRELVYNDGGRWFIGIAGDSDVTGIIGNALDDEE